MSGHEEYGGKRLVFERNSVLREFPAEAATSASKPHKPPHSALLRDEFVDRLHFAVPPTKPYTVRDTKLPGFHVDVGKQSKTFRVQADAPKSARRLGQQRKTIKRTVGKWPDVSARIARREAQRLIGEIKSGKLTDDDLPGSDGPTLKFAWELYKTRCEKKDRSAKTIEGYRDPIERLLKEWLDLPLTEIGRDRMAVKAMHSRMTKQNGAYMANRAMRAFRAVYNYALKTWELPANPVAAVDFNRETPRKNGLKPDDVPGWFDELQAIRNPRRREMHWFTLLSGLRSGDVSNLLWDHVDFKERSVFIHCPKGGEKRAFHLPLTGAMIDSLRRTMFSWPHSVTRIEGRTEQYEPAVERYFSEYVEKESPVFPGRPRQKSANSIEWTVEDTRERGENKLSKTGHALRHSFATLAEHAGVPREITARLMNHKPAGVTEGYVNADEILLTDLYRTQMENISQFIMSCLRPDQRELLLRPIGGRVGHEGAEILCEPIPEPEPKMKQRRVRRATA
jgi:integrase